jgi:hypothetical protein
METLFERKEIIFNVLSSLCHRLIFLFLREVIYTSVNAVSLSINLIRDTENVRYGR